MLSLFRLVIFAPHAAAAFTGGARVEQNRFVALPPFMAAPLRLALVGLGVFLLAIFTRH